MKEESCIDNARDMHQGFVVLFRILAELMKVDVDDVVAIIGCKREPSPFLRKSPLTRVGGSDGG